MKRFYLILICLSVSTIVFAQTKMLINKVNGLTDTVALSDIKNITFTFSTQSLNDSLVVYYPFNGNANDASGKGNNATVNGASLSSDRFGNPNQAYSFTSGNYIEAPNSLSLQSPVVAGTISLWASMSAWSGNTAALVCKGNTSAVGQYAIVLNNDSTFWARFNNGTQTLLSVKSPFAFNLNTWYHFAITWNQGVVNFYINGNFIGTKTFTGAIQVDNYALDLGRDTPGATEYFIGKMDEVRIYNRALSSTEIQALYNLK